jgi:GT2 family glycosyltransferase
VPDLVGVVLLNFGGAHLTIRCLESIFRLRYPVYRVVVVDNGSNDDSVGKIAAWAAGRQTIPFPVPAALREFVTPPVPKPVPTVLLRPGTQSDSVPADARLVIIDVGENRGVARGFNRGIEWLLRNTACRYVWLVNHDAVVHPDALAKLVERACHSSDVGICGSTICELETPERVHTLGGKRFNSWTAGANNIGEGSIVGERVDVEAVEQRLDFVEGASMLCTRRFLEKAGLIPERTFMYFEEQMWAEEARGQFRLAFAKDSLVYHRNGGCTEVGDGWQSFGNFSDVVFLHERLRFTWHYHPLKLPTVATGLVWVLVESVCRRRWRRVRAMLKARFWLPWEEISPQRPLFPSLLPRTVAASSRSVGDE